MGPDSVALSLFPIALTAVPVGTGAAPVWHGQSFVSLQTHSPQENQASLAACTHAAFL
jgi:hypothetical protein